MKGVNNLIESHLRHLKLKGIINDYKGISEIATEKKLTYEEYLSLLLENEVQRKKNSSYKARVDRAKFPYIKELDSFDFSFQPFLRELSPFFNLKNLVRSTPPKVLDRFQWDLVHMIDE